MSAEDEPELNEEEEEEDEDMSEGDYGMFDTGNLLASTLMTEEGDTVCTALVSISRHMEMQNKILVKILNALVKKNLEK